MLKEFKFDSGVNYGCEMVDVPTNATRRALSRNLGDDGWRYISKLKAYTQDERQAQGTDAFFY
jgi:hypothetical protein